MSVFSSQVLELNRYFGKTICEVNWKWSRDHEPFEDFDFWYVWEGEGEVTLNSKIYPVRSGDCFLFKPGDLSSAEHNPERPLTVTYIHFTAEEDHTLMMSLPSFVHFDPAEFHETYLDRFVHVRRTGAFGHEEEANALLKLILLLFERQAPANQTIADPAKRSMNRVMMDIAAHIRQDPGRQHQIQDLANQAHLSPRYFSLKFKEIMGQTIESYLIQSRIERATYLLKLGMNVSEVAEALGYRSIYFFSRQFKKVTGKNPSQLRS
ncbi:helix-turn-helix domain-containing protein [Paenibacillus qinlingensis]|uniref:helix-turn-helix domain-containing protein n=1 Tax=Paenibacillus qinlingensis TaxID=1837343 RepID=UPI0015649AAB|nr:AraC family transcriptional regulator [Paenibacillus qinlingensis]NQX57878.1 helix-turn-helix transcriptional regulator [Paenibacillus qinlingensis]